MRTARVRLHYGSMATGYVLAVALPVVMALARQKFGPVNFVLPFIYFYPAIWTVSYLWGPAPGAAAVLFSVLSAPLVLPVVHPEGLNWVALAGVGVVTVVFGSVLRATREAPADAARATLRFQLVTENMNDWVFFLDEGGRVDYANRAACSGIARTPADLAGKPLADMVEGNQRAEFSRMIQNAVIGPVPRREWLFARAEGAPIPVEVGCAAITTNRDTVIHVACRDLREQREAERKLREARQWEALGTLAGGLAHDFNNLLTAMMGNASLAREMLPPSHESAGLLDSILFAGARSSTLIEMMLAAAGYRRSFAQNIDLGPLLACAVAKVKAPENVQILTTAPPARFLGEYSSLERLLVCLIENAVESYGGAPGVVTIELGLAETPIPESFEKGDFEEGECRGDECLRMVIEDKGSGMDAATLERAFDPFFTTKFTGRGLGLAAVRGLVRAYFGRLWIRSRPGEGTLIQVWLPRQA
jgi:PAS domain S-box-containing protein